MKKLRQISVSTALAFVLSIPAAAGEIHTGIAPPPTPAVTAQSAPLTDAGYDAGAVAYDAEAETYAVGEIALDFIRGVLALF